MGFATLAKVKLMLGIPDSDTSRDELINCAVDAVNGEMLDIFCLEQCEPKIYTNTLDIVERGRQDWVKTPSYPIISIVSVVDADSGTAYDSSLLYNRPLGRILLKTGCFRYGNQTITATYLAGFEAGSRALAALSNAANQAAVMQVKVGVNVGFIEEKIGKYSYKLGSQGSGLIGADGLPLSWHRTMNRYIRAFAHTS